MPTWQGKWKDDMMENSKYQGLFFKWKVVTWRCSLSCQKASSAWFPWAIVISSCNLILHICFIVETCFEPGPITWVPYATSRDECSRTEHAYWSHPRNGGLRETNSPPIDFLTDKTDPFTSSESPLKVFNTSNKADTFVSLSARSVGLSCVAPFERHNTNLVTSYEG